MHRRLSTNYLPRRQAGYLLSTKRRRRRVSLLFLPLLLIVAVIILLRYLLPQSAAAAWFDDNWGYRQLVAITNTGTAQTDYQTDVTIDTATLITAGKMQSDCDDLRFTNTGGNVLPYWIEPGTCNSATTKVWVKLDAVHASGTDLYYYYGNASAPSVSSISTTFIRELSAATANWSLGDTDTNQSYAGVVNTAVSTGRELVINGGFDTDTVWTKGTGWTIASGVAHSDGTGATGQAITQALPVSIGKEYVVTYTVSNYVQGQVNIYFGGGSLFGTVRASNGTFSENIIADGTTLYIYNRLPGTNFIGDIDNVSVKEINIPATSATTTNLLTDGNMETAGVASWTATASTLSKQTTTPHGGSQVLRVTYLGGGAVAGQTVLTTGNVYRITGYARGDGTTVPRIAISGFGQGTYLTSSTQWQPFDLVVVAPGTSIQFGVQSGTGYTEFDDVVVSTDTSIRSGEIAINGGFATDTDWTKGTGWTIGGGVATCDGTNGDNIRQSTLVVGKTYTVTFSVSSYTSGSVQVKMGSGSGGTGKTAVGTYTETLVASGDTYFRLSSTNFIGSVDAVSVTEVSPEVGTFNSSSTYKPTTNTTANGHLSKAYSFDGTNDNVSIYSGSLNSAFNPNEGTLVAWAKYTGSWTDGTFRHIGLVQSDTNNFVYLPAKSGTNNTWDWAYKAGGTTKSSTVASGAPTGWVQTVITWSKSSDQVKAYVNGIQIGSTLTGLGTWTGNLASTTTIVGAGNTSGANPWSGLINDVRLYNRALGDDEISSMYAASYDVQAYTTNNYPAKELLRKYSPNISVAASGSEEKGGGPVAYWKFDEGQGTTAYDSTSNVKNATFPSAPKAPAWAPESQCISGKCLDFDGSDDYISVGTSTPLQNSTNKTVSFWAKPDTDATQAIPLLSNGTAQWYVGIANPTRMIASRKKSDGNQQATYSTTSRVVKNKWAHYTYTISINGSDVTTSFYINGVLVDTTTDANGYQAADTSPWVIGAFNTTSGFFDGKIDDLKVYNYVRSDAQIKAEFTARSTSKGAAVQMSIDQSFLSNGLVGYWEMNESTAASNRVDSSGNGITLTPSASNPVANYGRFGFGVSPVRATPTYLYASDTKTALTGDMTVASWIRPSSNTASTSYDIVAKWDGVDTSYMLVQYGTKLRFYLNSLSNYVETTSSVFPTGFIWYHVAASYSASSRTVALFVNGVQVPVTVSGTIPSSINSNTGRFQVGIQDSTTTPANGFNGRIDEVRLYSRAFSANDVAALYNWRALPVGQWSMDEGSGTTINDLSTSAGVSSAFVGNVAWTNGKFGTGLLFDGTDDVVKIPEQTPFDVGSAVLGFTVEAYFKTTTNFAGNATIVAKDDGSGAYPFSVYLDASEHACASIYNGTTTASLCGSAALNDGLWHHIAFRHDVENTLLVLFVDGTQVAETSDTTSASGSANNDNVSIGNSGTGTYLANDFTGSIDHVLIYTYSRASSEILQDARAGQSIGGSSTTQVVQIGFDEDAGTTAKNRSILGTSLDAALTSVTWKSASVCKHNACGDFDGSTSVATLTNASAIDFDENLKYGVTLSAWIYPETAGEGTGGQIFYKGANTWLATQNLSSGKLDLVASLDLGTSDATVTATGALTQNAWNHVALTYSDDDDDEVTLWVNGITVATSTNGSGSPAITESANLLVGGTTTNNFDGRIDDVHVYAGELSAADIALDQNANAGIQVGTGGSTEASTLADGAGADPVAYWNFDDASGTSAQDRSGNGNTGTLTNGPLWGNGKMGTAVQFDGVDDYVTAGDPASLRFTETNPFTIEAWFNLKNPDFSNSYEGIVDKRIVNDRYWIVVNSSYQVLVNVADGTNTLGTQSTTAVSQNQWNHAVLVYNGANTVKLYLNGILEGTGTSPTLSGLDTTGATFDIGREATNNRYFNGLIDDVKIYNYARTPAQVAYDYNRGAAVLWYKMDECQGSVINDSSGFGVTGTLTIGASGTQTSAGTCSTASTAWGNGASGKYNSSLNFDGAAAGAGDDYVSLGNGGISNKIKNATEFTFSAWTKVPTLLAQESRIISVIINGSNTVGPTFAIGAGNQIKIQAKSAAADALQSVTYNYYPSDGLWHHLVGTINFATGTGKIYLDGRLMTTGTGLTFSSTTYSYTSSTQPDVIGATMATGTVANTFPGQIDDVRVYNYGLSDAQVKNLYNNNSSVYFGL